MPTPPSPEPQPLEAVCSCGYRGRYWHKHRETSRRWHPGSTHTLLDALPPGVPYESEDDDHSS